MKRVIITGADGFVGSYTVKYFLNQGVEVLAIGKESAPKRLHFHKNMDYMQCDISDVKFLLDNIKRYKYDTFIHFAWSGSAGPARCDYNLQLNNALYTVECLKVAKELGCNRFVCAGSIMEYEVELVTHAQGSRLGMGYIYGIGKQTAHNMCKSIAANIGIDLIWPIITNAYGVGEISHRFISTTLSKIIKNQPLLFTAATQNYDFVYITDVAKAFYLIAKNGKPFCEYVIGSSKAKPLKEFILEIQCAFPHVGEFQFGDVPFTGINLPLHFFDTNVTEVDCGFKAEIDFKEGILMTMDWMRDIKKC